VALNVQVGSIVCPAAGSTTITLAAGFDPKAIICTTVGRTATGGGGGHMVYSHGWATYRGSSVQQCWFGWASEDAAATADSYPGQGNDALGKLTNGTTATIALNFSLSSMSSTSVVISWTTRITNAIVNYVVLGGTDVEDALAASYQSQNTPATQDVDVSAATGGSGWTGQPSLVLFGQTWNGTATFATADANASLGFGVKQGTANGRAFSAGSDDGAATQATVQGIWNNRVMHDGDLPQTVTDGQHYAIQLSADSAWPANGFEVTYNEQTALFAPWPQYYLALKLSANVTVTHGESAASTVLNGTNTLTSAGTPKLAFLFNVRTATANTVDSTSTDAAMFGVGFTDGSGNERWCGGWDDDAQGAAAICGTAQIDTKGIQYWVPSTDTKDADADVTVSGSNFVATWADQAPSAFLYEWFTLGETTAAAAEIPLLVMAPQRGVR
jgi:hypothetical protein